MARWKRSEVSAPVTGLRRAFYDWNEPLAQRFRALGQGTPWGIIVAAIDAGEPFWVKGYSFPEGYRSGIDRTAHYEIDVDGGVRELSEDEFRGAR